MTTYSSEAVKDYYRKHQRILKLSLRKCALCTWAVDQIKDKSVLDFGCGDGFVTQILSEVAGSIIGVDLSVESAQRMFNKNLFFSLDQINPEKKFDVVTFFDVLEHIPERDEDNALSYVCGAADTVLFSLPQSGLEDKKQIIDRDLTFDYVVDKFKKFNKELYNYKQFVVSPAERYFFMIFKNEK